MLIEMERFFEISTGYSSFDRICVADIRLRAGCGAFRIGERTNCAIGFGHTCAYAHADIHADTDDAARCDGDTVSHAGTNPDAKDLAVGDTRRHEG